MDSLFAALFIGLTTVMVMVILKLRANNRALLQGGNAFDKNYFKSEINALSFILFFFSVSYLLRVIFDTWIGFEMRFTSFTVYVLVIFVSIPTDLLPIALILNFHRRCISQS